jgi:DNA repair protein RadC
MENKTILSERSVAEIELSYNPVLKVSSLPKIQRSEDAYRLFLETWDKTKLQFVEQFKVMLLNRANKVLGICTLSSGSSTETIVSMRLIFAVALKSNSCKIILAHNHPSQNLTPGSHDQAVTLRAKEAGSLLDLSVLDHLIISSDGYYSFADEGEI